MRNYVNNFSNASERATGILAFTGARYTVEGSHDLRFINIDTSAKTVTFSNSHNDGTQLWSTRAVMDLLESPAVEPVAEAVEDSNKAYVVKDYAGDTTDLEEIFILNGWTVSGLRTMPYINFKPETKEISFASIASGERFYTKADVIALLGEDYDVPEIEVDEEVEIEEPVEEIEVDEVAEEELPVPSLFAGLVIPKYNKYKTDAVAQTKAYSVRVLTDGDMELTGDSEDFAVVIN